MTDGGEMTDERPVPAETRSATAPQPLGLPEAPRRPGLGRRIILASVLVVLAACGLAVWAGWAFVTYFEELGLDGGVGSPALRDLQTPVSVWWSGNGEYVVAQALDEDDTPKVVIRDVKRGTTRTLKGYRVVGVEPHVPRVWLVPDKRALHTVYESTEATPQLLDIAWDGTDSAPSELYALRLDTQEDPRSDVDARWTTWTGAAGYSASVEIDINKGSCPGSLRFEKDGSSLNAWSAKVPTDVATFEPIGWSPSGLYFAVVSQADASETAKLEKGHVESVGLSTSPSDTGGEAGTSYEEFPDPEGKPPYTAAVLVFSAVDGRLAARDEVSAPLHDVNSAQARVTWSATEDRLFLLDYSDMGTGPRPLRTLPVGATIANTVETTFAPWEDMPGESVWLAGSDGEAALVGVSDVWSESEGIVDVYRVGAAGAVEHLGAHKGGLALRWSPVGGMLALSGSEGDGVWNVYTADIHGAGRSRLLELEAPKVDPGY